MLLSRPTQGIAAEAAPTRYYPDVGIRSLPGIGLHGIMQA